MAPFQLPSPSLVQLVHLHLLSSGFTSTSAALRQESSVGLPGSLTPLASLCKLGKWGDVLTAIERLDSVPSDLLGEVKEVALLELIRDDRSLAEAVKDRMIDGAEISSSGKKRIQKALETGVVDFGNNKTAQERREEVGRSLDEAVPVCTGDALMSLVLDGLRWRQRLGLIPPEAWDPDSRWNICTGSVAPSRKRSAEVALACVKEVAVSKKMSDLSAPLAIATAPRLVITGSLDGLIEVRSSETLKIHPTSYQAKEEYMSHPCGVTALQCSEAWDMLASGDKEGTLKVWDVEGGRCLRSFKGVLEGAVETLAWAGDGSRVVVGGRGGVKVVGLRSGTVLESYDAPGDIVSHVVWCEGKVAAGCAGGTVKVWQGGQPEPKILGGEGSAVIRIRPVEGGLVVVRKSSEAKEHDWDGNVVKTFVDGFGDDIRDGDVSKDGRFLYTLTQDNVLTGYDFSSGKMERRVEGRGEVHEVVCMEGGGVVGRGKEGKKDRVYVWA